MSFVYAEKWGDTFDVHCDTKIDLEKASVSFSSEQARLIDKYGIVKTTIICPEISISFAGNDIFRASLLFHRLFEKKRLRQMKWWIWHMRLIWKVILTA